MALMKNEAKEWESIRNKARRYKIKVVRVGPANIKFGEGVYAQLGTGRGTEIINAKIKLIKKYK